MDYLKVKLEQCYGTNLLLCDEDYYTLLSILRRAHSIKNCVGTVPAFKQSSAVELTTSFLSDAEFKHLLHLQVLNIAQEPNHDETRINIE